MGLFHRPPQTGQTLHPARQASTRTRPKSMLDDHAMLQVRPTVGSVIGPSRGRKVLSTQQLLKFGILMERIKRDLLNLFTHSKVLST